MNKNLLALSVAVTALASSASAAVSSNIVGYVNLTFKKGLNLVSNPLNNTAANGNNISNLFGDSLGDAFIYTWNGSSYVTSSFLDGVGLTGLPGSDIAIPPGVSFFVEVDVDKTVTFVGDALVGTQTQPIITGNNFVASKIPISGTFSELGLGATDGDTVYTWNNGFVANDYAVLVEGQPGTWTPNPVIAVGQGVIMVAIAPNTWTKTFNVQ
jgi:hypothetical protein